MRTALFIMGFLIVVASLYSIDHNWCYVFIGLTLMGASVIEITNGEKEGNDEK